MRRPRPSTKGVSAGPRGGNKNASDKQLARFRPPGGGCGRSDASRGSHHKAHAGLATAIRCPGRYGGLAGVEQGDKPAVHHGHLTVVASPADTPVCCCRGQEARFEHNMPRRHVGCHHRLAERQRARHLGLALAALAIKERQRQRGGGIDIETGVAAGRGVIAQGSTVSIDVGDFRPVVAQADRPQRRPLIPCQRLLARGAQRTAILVGQRPGLLAVSLAEREPQHIGAGDIGCRGYHHGIKVMRRLHAVKVGRSAAVAVNHHFVTFAQHALFGQFLIGPSQGRLQFRPGSLIIFNGDGTDIHGAFGRSTLQHKTCLVRGKGWNVQPLCDVHIDIEVF